MLTEKSPEVLKLLEAIYSNNDEQFDLMLKNGANIHVSKAEGNVYVNCAIDYGNLYALQRLLPKVNPQQPLIYALTKEPQRPTCIPEDVLKSTRGDDEAAIKKLREKALYLILGQQPQLDWVAIEFMASFFGAVPLLKEIAAQQKNGALWPKPDKQHSQSFTYICMKSLSVVLCPPGPLIHLIALINAEYQRMNLSHDYEQFLDKHTKKYPIKYGRKSTLLTSFCIRALNKKAEISFRNLLTLCVQQQLFGPEILNKKYLKNNSKKSPLIDALNEQKNQWIFDNNAYLRSLFTAFAPYGIQANLRKKLLADNTKRTGKQVYVGMPKNLRDAKIFFDVW